MFASLLLARTEERSSAFLRRLLYGYNAALTGLLLLAILAVGNVLVYTLWPTSYNWTRTRGLYDLSSKSRNVLANLKQPTRVYVLMSQGGRVFYETQRLLDNMQAVSDKLRVEYISPDQQPDRVEKLVKSYPKLTIGRGLLMVYGPEGTIGVGGAEPQAAFINQEALFDSEAGGRSRAGEGQPTLVFKGENVVVSELSFLARGRTRPKIYFTQDNGELGLADTKAQGAANLHRLLEKANFEVVKLYLREPIRGDKVDPSTRISKRVPEDAAVVVIANPRTPFAPEAVAALQGYMKRGGKLLVLLDLVEGREVTAPRTGLEGLLADFDVEVTNQMVMALRYPQGGSPATVTVVPPEGAKNPIVKELASTGEPVILDRVRPLRRLNRSRAYQTDTLLEAPKDYQVWAESENLQGAYYQPLPYASFLLRTGRVKLSPEPLPVAMAVSEANRGAARVVVFGDATFVSNRFQPQYQLGFDIFQNSLQWLTGRTEDLGLSPQKSERFTLNTAAVNPSRLVLLPGLLMVLGVIGLGAGIWVVRRR
jgi:hypothetical protein